MGPNQVRRLRVVASDGAGFASRSARSRARRASQVARAAATTSGSDETTTRPVPACGFRQVARKRIARTGQNLFRILRPSIGNQGCRLTSTTHGSSRGPVRRTTPYRGASAELLSRPRPRGSSRPLPLEGPLRRRSRRGAPVSLSAPGSPRRGAAGSVLSGTGATPFGSPGPTGRSTRRRPRRGRRGRGGGRGDAPGARGRRARRRRGGGATGTRPLRDSPGRCPCRFSVQLEREEDLPRRLPGVEAGRPRIARREARVEAERGELFPVEPAGLLPRPLEVLVPVEAEDGPAAPFPTGTSRSSRPVSTTSASGLPGAVSRRRHGEEERSPDGHGRGHRQERSPPHAGLLREWEWKRRSSRRSATATRPRRRKKTHRGRKAHHQS